MAEFPRPSYILFAMPKLSIRDLDLADKRVFIRVDFNVPLSKEGTITDDTRIRETIPTIEYALRRKAKVILAAHLGRPKGKRVDTMSLRPVVDRLRQLLENVLTDGENVAFAPDCVGPIAREMAGNLESGQTLLLENLRFHNAEEANDPAFAKQLAELCDVYVDDAFGAAHRAHASTEGITHFVKQKGGQCAAGLLMEKELNYLSKAVTDANRPFIAIIGGAKVSDKIEVINALLDKVDALLIGGAMAYTFLNAKGQTTGKSLTELDKIDVARAAMAEGRQARGEVSPSRRSRPRRQVRRRRQNTDLLRRRPLPRERDGPRHRSRDHQALLRRDRRRRHHRLERPHGRRRTHSLRQRHQRDRARHRKERGLHLHRRWR